VHGTAVRGYHIVNLAFHIGAALLLFGVVKRSFASGAAVEVGESQPREAQVIDGFRIALTVAVLWAVHPLLTSSVTYVSQRTEVLMGFFYLGTLYAFIRGVQEQARIWLPLSVAACFLGIASKETMVTAPVLVLLYDWAFVAGSLRQIWQSRWGYYLALSGCWLLLFFLMSGLNDRAVGYGLGVTWWTYVLTECQAVLHYLRLVAWPTPLVFDYGVLFVDTLGEAWPAVTALVLLLLTTVFALFRWPRVGFLAAAFFLILSPTSSIVPVATQPIAENRVYLPAAAIIALLAVGIQAGIAKRGWGALMLAAGALTCLSIQRNDIFKAGLTLWHDTVAKRPDNPRAHSILGEMLYGAGRLQAAKAQFEKALALKPDYYEAHNNIGTTLYALGDAAGARRHFEAALRLRPDFPAAHNNLANVLLQFGEVDNAGHHAEEALRLYSDPNRLKPDLAETHNNLANVRLYQGNVPDARQHYEAALRLKPDFLQARMNLAVSLRLMGQLRESNAHLEQLLQAMPDFPEAQFNHGLVLEQMGQFDAASRRFANAINLKPEFVEARVSLAMLLARGGDLEGAKKELEAASRLRPGDTSISAKLEQVIAALRGKEASKSKVR
jgi:protein O-mannosyl-transferase